MERDLGELEDLLRHRFEDPELLLEALTHPSYGHEQERPDYERLEFLGDAVLGMVTGAWLFRTLPEAREGELSRLRGFLVSAPVLARIAADLGLGDWVRLGAGEERSGGRAKPSLLAAALEAVVGALYLDGGLAPVARLLEPALERQLGEAPAAPEAEAKSRLQEALQAAGRPLPEYRIVEESGPAHERRFTVECLVDGRVAGRGRAATKKEAEQRAAREALAALPP